MEKRTGARFGFSIKLLLRIVMFAAALFIAFHWQGSARYDWSEDGAYTLSSGTRSILQGVDEPIAITLYASTRSIRGLPHLEGYLHRVQAIIREMQLASPHKLTLKVVDPAPYSDDEDRAFAAGLLAVPNGVNGERVFFGLSARNREGKQLSIPFFDLEEQAYLEYNISKLLYMLTDHPQPRVDIISSLPLDDDDGQWSIMQQLKQLYAVNVLAPDTVTVIDDAVDALLVIHPRGLPDAAVYAIDQFILRGGHVALFVDPDAEMDVQEQASAFMDITGTASSMPRLFAHWGVDFDTGKIVLDRKRALSIRVQDQELPWQHPAVLGLTRKEFNQRSPIMTRLQTVNLSSAGFFELSKDASLRFEPLMQSSDDAMIVDKRRVSLHVDPDRLLRDFNASGEHYAFATLLEGRFSTAFPERDDADHRAQGQGENQVILIGDTDILSDRLWVEANPYFGERVLSVFAGNADFIGNIVDYFSGNDALLSIRGHYTYARPFTRVEALRDAADQWFRHKEQQLQTELIRTEQELAKLQPDSDAMDDALREEMDRNLERKISLRDELRDVQQHLNAEIDRMDRYLKLINILLVPALVGLFGILYGLLRYRRSHRSRRHR